MSQYVFVSVSPKLKDDLVSDDVYFADASVGASAGDYDYADRILRTITF